MANKKIAKNKTFSGQAKNTLLFLFGVLLVALALILLMPDFRAESGAIPPAGELGVPIPGSGPVTNFYEYVSALIEFCTTTLGPMIAVIMVMYGGYRYIFAEGDNTAMTGAKDTIYGAIWGYIILFMANFILNTLGI